MSSADAPSGTAPGFTGHGRHDVTLASELISVDAYRDHILGQLPDPGPIELRATEALGLVLAEDVVAADALPPFANSAMDGYALVAADVARATQSEPVTLPVRGEIAAGARSLPTLTAGSTVRIMTGAPLPPGADAVVPVENTSGGDSQVRIHRAVQPGEHVRTVGEDVRPGQGMIRAGNRVSAADVGLLAAVGVPRVACIPPPRVVVISTGDELVSADAAPGPGQIRDANGPMLISLVRQAGAIPFWAGIVGDDRRALAHALDANLGHADLVITSGGVSAGLHDHLRDVVATLGEAEAFKVAIKPGMPQVFGRISGVPVFGLPGNPVSSFVSFEVFVRPAIRHLQGRSDLHRPAVTAELTEPITTPPHKRTYVRVRLRREAGRWLAASTGDQGSHLLTSVVRADGLAEVPEDVTDLAVGQEVRVHLLVES